MNGRQKIQDNVALRKKGFSLVELIIVVSILSILGMIAIPMYREYNVKATRSNATSIVDSFPLLLETYRAENSMMCPDCNADGTHTYNYIENDQGTPTTDTITPNYPDFKPKAMTQAVSLYHYRLEVTVAGCPACVETAVVTALPQTHRGAPAGNIQSLPYN